MRKMILQLGIGLAVAAVMVAVAVQAATAQAICTIWTKSNGKTYAILYKDPGGDGALYVYVDGAQTTYFSSKNRTFYVTSKKNAVVRGYNSKLEWQCSN